MEWLSFSSSEDLCLLKYNNCNNQASAVYSWAVLSCTAAALGLGTLTFGIGGIAFQLACGATAYYYLTLQRESCTIDFRGCNLK